VLPTTCQEEAEIPEPKIYECDPNEVVEQLDELEPIESSVEEDIEDEEDIYLSEDLEKNREELKRMMAENSKRKSILENLIQQKEGQLFVKLPQE
jgi:hypothetical protein